jgi:hypothetical protein
MAQPMPKALKSSSKHQDPSRGSPQMVLHRRMFKQRQIQFCASGRKTKVSLESLIFVLVITMLLGMVVHICNPSTWEAEGGGSWIWGQPGLHSKTESQNNNDDNNNKRKISGLFSPLWVEFSPCYGLSCILSLPEKRLCCSPHPQGLRM